MNMKLRGRLVPVALVVGASLAGPIAGAQASNASIARTLIKANPRIAKDEKAVSKGLKAYSHGKVKPAVKALRHEVSDIDKLVAVIKRESPSNASGRTAKHEIDHGLGLIAKAYGHLATDIRKAGPGGVPASQVNAAVRTDKKGQRIYKAGVKKLSHS